MYKLHKWLAVTVGVFFLAWLISGIVMVLPALTASRERRVAPAPLDFQRITISPNEAVRGLTKSLGELPQVNAVILKKIANTPVYEIVVTRGSSRLVDAESGDLFTITPEVGKQIARDYAPFQARVTGIEIVTRHSFAYLWGPLPAYRVVFDNDGSTAYYVSVRNGAVQRSDSWSRIQETVAALHTFQPLKLLSNRDAVRKGLLILLSLVGIGAVGVGYYLALPRWRP